MTLRTPSLLRLTLFTAACAAIASSAVAQTNSVYFEAESGTRGAEFTTGADGAVQYITITTDSTGQNPGASARVATYSVTFPAAGTYELYARIRVGAAAGSDDSFFYASTFGAKTASADADWILANNLSSVGYTTATSTVSGGGTAGSSVWKWIKLSDFDGGETPVRFTVSAGSLTQTFEIGARENGLEIDRFAFGLQNTNFTVANLDASVDGTASTSSEPYTPPGPPLATGKTKFLGSAYSSPSQTLHFERYWNQVTPENAAKWGSVEGTRDVMNWSALDAAYNFAKANNFSFKFHTLIWGSQQPSWISSLPASEQLAEITEWYAAAAERYPDIDQIDVVNEPIRATPNGSESGRANYIAALGGTGASGWDWVLTSFRMARQYFPRAKLLINEYSVTNSDSVTATYAQIINLLKAENLIDGIGIQQHAFETRGVSSATISRNMDTLAALGLPIYITELDIDGLSDQLQLEEYQRLFPLFWEHPAVGGITLWGWRPGLWRNEQGAYIVLENGAERPAMQWLKAYVGNHAPVVPTHTFAVAEGAAGGTVVGTVRALDSDSTTFQTWQITGGTGSNLFSIHASTGEITVANGAALVPSSYTLNVTTRDDYTVSAAGTITVNVSNQPQKVLGGGYEFAGNITHANGNVYDQILITGPTTTFRADAGQIVRASYIDIDDDIVQLEFSGSGTVTVSLAGATPPALPTKYNQDVSYVKGHATITIEGAGDDTHFSAFTVGSATAVNQALFKAVDYDGYADIAVINITSPTNRFASLRTANVEYWNTDGNTGVNAPGVQIAGPVFVHDVTAEQQATPVLLTGTIGTYTVGADTFTNAILITGGSMAQPNGRAVQVGDVGRIVMRAGSDSHGEIVGPVTNQGVYERNGVNVTATLTQ